MESEQGPRMILVVDDEELVAALARDILKRFGYTVLVTQSGEEAVELYRNRAPEIAAVLLDMVMPGMDGREVFKRLHAMDPRVKIIVSSGYDNDQDADALLLQGATGFIQKPYRITELVKVVNDAVGGGKK